MFACMSLKGLMCCMQQVVLENCCGNQLCCQTCPEAMHHADALVTVLHAVHLQPIITMMGAPSRGAEHG